MLAFEIRFDTSFSTEVNSRADGEGRITLESVKNKFSSYLSTLGLGKADGTVLELPVPEAPQTQQKAATSLYPYWKVCVAI